MGSLYVTAERFILFLQFSNGVRTAIILMVARFMIAMFMRWFFTMIMLMTVTMNMFNTMAGLVFNCSRIPVMKIMEYPAERTGKTHYGIQAEYKEK